MTRLLDRIDGPADLHGPLRRRARSRSPRRSASCIIDTVGEIGGHFGANLGTCELAVALHSLLDSPTRQDPLGRRPPGLPAQGPHRPPRPSSTRSASTAASRRSARSPSPSTTSWAPATPRPRSATRSASRRRCARACGEDGRVVAVIGDGAMTGGVAFEAIHQAGGLGTPIVVVLNDNGMSIAPNVGALSRYFNRVRLEPEAVARARGRRERPDRAARRASAPRSSASGPQLKESIKAFWAPGLFWEELDWAYMGVIDGHDVRALRQRAARGARGRAPGRRAHRDGQGQGLRARRGGRPGGHGEVARRQAEVDRQRRGDARAERSTGDAKAPRRRRSTRQVFGEALVARVRARRARRRHHRRDELRHRA